MGASRAAEEPSRPDNQQWDDDAQRTHSTPDMAAYFDLRCTPERRYLEMTLRGIWDDAIFDAFARCYLTANRTMAPHGGVAYSLVDASTFGVQTSDITERFPALVHQIAPSPERRAAMVVPTLVNKVQARHAGDLVNARYFRTVESAVDWLFSNEA